MAQIHACELKMLRAEAQRNGDTPLRIQSLRGHIRDVEDVERDVLDIVSLHFYSYNSEMKDNG